MSALLERGRRAFHNLGAETQHDKQNEKERSQQKRRKNFIIYGNNDTKTAPSFRSWKAQNYSIIPHLSHTAKKKEIFYKKKF